MGQGSILLCTAQRIPTWWWERVGFTGRIESTTRALCMGVLPRRSSGTCPQSSLLFQGFGDDNKTILSILKGNNNPQTGCVSKGRGGFQLQYLALTAFDDWAAWGKNFPTKVQQPDLVEEQVRNDTQQYDFLAVTERMLDESRLLLYNGYLGSMSVMSSQRRQKLGEHMTIMGRNEAASPYKKPICRQWCKNISNRMNGKPSITVTIFSTRLRIEAWT